MIEWIAALIGWKTRYHIAWMARDNSGRINYGCAEFTATPWFTGRWINETSKHIADKFVANTKDDGVVITSVTKL